MSEKKSEKKPKVEKVYLSVPVGLGMEVEDIVTGFEGIATARSEFLNGCVRFMVESRMQKDVFPTPQWFDVQQLQVVKVDTKSRELYMSLGSVTGGPHPNATPRRDHPNRRASP